MHHLANLLVEAYKTGDEAARVAVADATKSAQAEAEEASRVRGERLAGEPSSLRLSEMLKFEVPDEFAGDVVVPHIATLWVLDRDKDG